MLDTTMYMRLRARIDRYEASRERLYPGVHCFTPEMIAAVVSGANGPHVTPMDAAPTNDERSQVEEYEFANGKAERYFAYVDDKRPIITTWTGTPLGRIVERGYRFRSNMGDIRQYLRIIGINGQVYSAVYFCSAGSYCRMRRVKRRKGDPILIA